MPEPPTTNHPRPTVLIVSNGYGEDGVGNALAKELSSHAQVIAYPLVGVGTAYQGFPLLDPRRALPSGGFGLRGSWRGLWQDLRAGGVGLWLEQRKTLRRAGGRHHLIVAIGDVYCLWMAAHAGSPVTFIATAKSEYNEPHRWIERVLIRRLARMVFTRDQPTADALAKAGIPVRYVGNPLMDTIQISPQAVPCEPRRPTVTILPGGRADAYVNFPNLLQLCEAISRQVDVNFLCALPPAVEMGQVQKSAQEAGWAASDEVLRSGAVEVKLIRSFGDAARAASIVIGLAGTANEQAAGLGKPVVAFPGQSAQYSKQFMILQKRLLGDALIAAPGWKEAAQSVLNLLADPQERDRRGSIGRQRMGPPGAVEAIATEMIGLLANS